MLDSILIAVALVASTGIIASIILVLASHFMRVEVDETVTKLRDCLPGANCGACGYTGCMGYAEALSKGGVKTNLCIPGGNSTAEAVAEVLGVESESVEAKVAFVECGGDCNAVKDKADYVGVDSCRAASMIYGGPSSCTFGCVGCGDCRDVCPVDAICIENKLARVDRRLCIGCGKCVEACPKHIILLYPIRKAPIVMCHNKDKGALTRKICSSGCIGCKKCELNCPEGAIKVESNLAHIDYEKCTDCGKCAELCPVKCIKDIDLSVS